MRSLRQQYRGHNADMRTFQIVVTPVPYVDLWEVEVVGVGVTQSESPAAAEIEEMARDYLSAMGEDENALLQITHTAQSLPFARLQAYAAALRTEYDRYNQIKRNRPWDVGDFTMGAMNDFGTLARHIMAFQGHRDDPAGGVDLPHHLADMLWSVITIAAVSGTDLEAAFMDLFERLQVNIAKEIEQALAQQQEPTDPV